MPEDVGTAAGTLYQDMRSAHLTPLWTLEGDIMSTTPRPKSRPWMWKWSTLYDIAERAGRSVPVERGGDRRAIALSNPGLGGLPYATNTLWAAVQWLNGREVAPAHRHTSNAVRFIIDGAGSYSTVDGDQVFLERGDLVLTPAWTWHDHGSISQERAIWMDGLDIPLNNYLDASFFEPYPKASQAPSGTLNGTVLKYGVGQMRPAWEKPSTSPPMSTYKWADTERALTNLAQADASPFDDVALEFTNPHTGSAVLPTLGCWIQLIRPGVRTRAHRHTGSAVYLAFEGHGSTIIDGMRFDWGPGDMFVVPSWAFHEHWNASSERAILFSINDLPVVAGLGKYREQPFDQGDGHQNIAGAFDSKA